MKFKRFMWEWAIPLVVILFWVFSMLQFLDPIVMLVGYDSGVVTAGVTWFCWWYNKQPKQPMKDNWYYRY